MGTNSVFIEQAAAEIAAETVFPGQKEADELLQATRAHIYHWESSFPGFKSSLVYLDEQKTYEALFEATESRRINVSWAQDFDARWVRFQLEELISHREAPERSKMASKTGCELGDEHPIYGHKVIFVGDKMGSFYRLKDNKITQIGRSYGKMDFIINIDAHHNFGTVSEPRYAAGTYTAFYWHKDSGALVKTETYQDNYTLVGGVPLPASRQVGIAEAKDTSGLSIRYLEFSGHQLLQSKPISQERE